MTTNDAHLRYQALKELMESRAQKLHQGLRALLSGPADPVEVRDPEEWGRTSAEQDVDLTLMEMQADTCRRIDEALQRLEKGTYGSCEECDEEIPAAVIAMESQEAVGEPRTPVGAGVVRCEDSELTNLFDDWMGGYVHCLRRPPKS